MHGEYGAPRGCCTLAMFTLFLDGSSKPSLGVQPDSLSFQSPEFMKSTPLHKPSSPSLISCFPPPPCFIHRPHNVGVTRDLRGHFVSQVAGKPRGQEAAKVTEQAAELNGSETQHSVLSRSLMWPACCWVRLRPSWACAMGTRKLYGQSKPKPRLVRDLWAT